MSLKRLIFLVNAYQFCVGTIFILPVIIPYYNDHLGLTFRQFMIGEAVFAAVIIAMEIPSGWMSDIWSRKYTLMIGCATAIAGYTGMLLASGVYSAVFAQAVLGIGVACNSGTITAILYDSLKAKGKEHLYQRLEGKRHGIGLYAVAIGSIAGGVLYQIDGRLPLILDVITLVCAFTIAGLLVEPHREKRAAGHHPIKDMWITIRYAIHGHKEIAGIIIVSTVLFCTTKMVMWTQQPYMQLIDIPTAWFGYIIAGGFLFGGAVGQFGHRLNHALSNRYMLALLVCAVVLLMGGAILLPCPPSVIMVLTVSGIWGFGFPFVQNAINKHADPARRATILSTLGFFISLMFIPAGVVMGYLDEHYSILYAMAYLIIQLGLLSMIGLYLWSKGTAKA